MRNKYEHYLKLGTLLEIIKENNIPEDVLVCYHRIEDRYFDGNDINGMRGSDSSQYPGGVYPVGTKAKGWDTIKIKGDNYYDILHHKEQIERGKLVIEGKLNNDEVGKYYWHDDYKESREKLLNIDDEECFDQYIPAFWAYYNKEKNILCITAHY